MARKDEDYEVFAEIPVNYDEGFSIFGKTLKRRNLPDSIVLGGLSALITYLFIYDVLLIEDDLMLIVYTAMGFLAGFILGIIGRNYDPWSIFLWNKITARKRITLYNPRIKYEKISEQRRKWEEESGQAAPDEEPKSVYQKFMEKMAERSKVVNDTGNTAPEKEETFIFEEDINVADNIPKNISKRYKKRKKVIGK